MNVKVLLENTQARPDALTEHGLSLYIETARHKLLFDMGQTDLFARNAQILGVDLGRVDVAVLSHGHYDHGGGLARFMALNKTAPIYISRHAFDPYYAKDGRYIGLDHALWGNPRFVPVSDHFVIDEELELCAANELPRPHRTDSGDLTMLREHKMCPDDFRHEQYLLIHDGERRILLSGCAHKGVLNLMAWFHPDVFLGGFHFMNYDPDGAGKRMLDQAAGVLNAYPASYYTGHCTGVAQYDFLKARMPGKLHYLACGQVTEI